MIHLLLMTFIFNFFSCEGADPILDRASTVKNKQLTPSDESKTEVVKRQTPTAQKNKDSEQHTDIPQKNVTEIKKDEEQITISGEIIAENWSGKMIRIDVFDGDQQSLSGPRPSVVKVEYQNKPGSFSILVPKSEQGLWIGGYIDEDGDGKPGPKDPSGWYENNPISAKDNAKDVRLVLSILQDVEE